jgi:predicted secreted protein
MESARIVLLTAALLGCPSKPPAADSATSSVADASPLEASVTEAPVEAAAPIASASASADPPPAQPKDAGAPTEKASGSLTVDESSAGKTIDVSKGQKIVVQLKWTPSSGYDWEVTKSPPALGKPEEGVVSAGDVPGAKGLRRFTFTAKDTLPAGEHAIEFGYRRDFEKGKPPAKTFSFKVRPAK